MKEESHGTWIASLAHWGADPHHPPRHVPVPLIEGDDARHLTKRPRRETRAFRRNGGGCER